MANGKARFRSLTFTVNLFLVLALAAGVGLVMAAFTLSLLSSRDQLTRSALLQQGNIIYTSIANFMLPGDAPLAVKFVSQVSLSSPESAIALYRRDGTPAFSDNATIERVNSNIKQAKFAPRAEPVPQPARPATPRFKEAASSPPQEVFFSEGEGGNSYFRAYRPLINLPKCTGCHGSDHTVRGVIDIRSDVSSFIRTQNLTIAGGAGGVFLVVGLLAFFIGAFLRSLVLSPIRSIGRLCAEVTSGSFEGRVEAVAKNEIGDLARTVNQMVGGLRERFELTKYVSRGTIGALTDGQRPQRVQRTLLFTDVRGFTAYTERNDPERVVASLNRLLEKQAEIIHEWGGDIDKFVGDEVVSVFSGDNAAVRACSAARDIVRLCALRGEDFDGLAVGVGAASGPIIQGMIGSERRADFTVIGDSVNVASRLCSIAKAGQVIVSDATKTAAGEAFSFKGPFGAKLKGKAAPQKVWLLLVLAASLVLGGCSRASEEIYAPSDYPAWARTTAVVLDYPIPGHENRLRIPRMNAVGFSAVPSRQGGKLAWDFPEDTVIVKEVYSSARPAPGEKPIQLTIMAKEGRDKRAEGGWLWIVKNLPDGKETVFAGNFCVTCHANANEKHPYGDGNPNEDFRDYVFFVPGEATP